MIVKICGLTTLEDALAAVEAGADMLGFNFYPPSPRCLTPLACRTIITELEKCCLRPITVGVFVNASAAQVQTILDECGLDLAQLSGDEPPQILLSLGQRAFKALRPMDANALQQGIRSYPARLEPPAWLIDACQPGKYGGTGQTANWHLAAGAALHAPILLAGGLKPDNVAAAVAQVQPWGVDTASGVESAPGRKDTRQMAAFIQAARQTNQEKMQW